MGNTKSNFLADSIYGIKIYHVILSYIIALKMTPFIKKRSRANPSRGVSAIIYFLDSIWHYSIAWCQSCKTKTKENADKGYTHTASQRAHWSAEQSVVLAASQPCPKHQLSKEQQCRTAWRQPWHHRAGLTLPCPWKDMAPYP